MPRIRLWSQSPAKLPEVVVIKNRGYPPIRKENGTEIGKIPAGTEIGPDGIAIEFDPGELGKNSYAKLFLGDPLQAQRFRLVPQSYQKLKLF